MLVDPTVKTFGIAVGVLLFTYAFAIAKMGRFSAVSDKYASAFSTVGLLLVLVAVGGFTHPPINTLLEAGGYAVGAIGGTVAFWRISNHKRWYKKA